VHGCAPTRPAPASAARAAPKAVTVPQPKAQAGATALKQAGTSQPVQTVPPSRGSPSGTVAEARTPSLQEARQAQAEQQAATLHTRTGVTMERIEAGSAPAWWLARTDAGLLLGSARARSLESAYNGAVAKARNAAPEGAAQGPAATVTRAAYSRVFPSGEFTAWVAMRTGASAPLATVAATTPTTPTTATPATAPPAAGGPPAWWVQNPSESGGQVIVGAQAEAPTLREAPRRAVEAGRARLAALLNKPTISDLTTIRSASFRLADGTFRTYVMVSAAGSLRK